MNFYSAKFTKCSKEIHSCHHLHLAIRKILYNNRDKISTVREISQFLPQNMERLVSLQGFFCRIRESWQLWVLSQNESKQQQGCNCHQMASERVPQEGNLYPNQEYMMSD